MAGGFSQTDGWKILQSASLVDGCGEIGKGDTSCGEGMPSRMSKFCRKDTCEKCNFARICAEYSGVWRCCGSGSGELALPGREKFDWRSV